MELNQLLLLTEYLLPYHDIAIAHVLWYSPFQDLLEAHEEEDTDKFAYIVCYCHSFCLMYWNLWS